MKMHSLGDRIAIIGPSNSGKSTLANAIGKYLQIPVCHMDQIVHLPGTAWVPRSEEEWIPEHDDFINQGNWVVEGNYSCCMPQRFARASSVIWLDLPLLGCMWRYIKRSIKNNPNRPGNLERAKSEFNFNLIRYTLCVYPQKAKKYESILTSYPDLKLIRLKSFEELDKFYQETGLQLND